MQQQESRTNSTMFIAMYQAAAQHWAHAEQVRWTLLYNYLMANTILLLGWATVFVSSDGPRNWIASVALCIAGAVIGFVWIAAGMRASDFVDMYGKLGKSFEESGEQPTGETQGAIHTGLGSARKNHWIRPAGDYPEDAKTRP